WRRRRKRGGKREAMQRGWGCSKWQLRATSPLELLHHLDEILKQIVRIVRTRRRFRVVLHGEQRQIPVAHAFERGVVQIHVRQFDFALRQRIGIDGKVMVMRGDLDPAPRPLLDRMIPAVVAEFQLEGLPSERNSGELMSEANSENRLE